MLTVTLVSGISLDPFDSSVLFLHLSLLLPHLLHCQPLSSLHLFQYFKPIQMEGDISEEGVIALPKLDGFLATLTFYPEHFVVSNIMSSKSYPHRIPQKHFYKLKDYVFMVESELYKTEKSGKPNAMAIIDLQTGSAFNPKERYRILQDLKKKFEELLGEYNIFVNSEDWFKPLLLRTSTAFSQNYHEPLTLHHNMIYEVLLDDQGWIERVWW